MTNVISIKRRGAEDPVDVLRHESHRALASTQVLKQLCEHEDPVVQRGAASILGLLVRNAAPKAEPPPMPGSAPANQLFGWFRTLEDWLEETRASMAVWDSVAAQRLWTWGRLLTTVGVGLAVGT